MITEIWDYFKGLWSTKHSAWVLIHNQKAILLGKRSKSSRRPGEWNFFGGRVDPGELPIHTALRELREETGIHASLADLKPLGHIDGYHYFAYSHLGKINPQPTSEIQKFKYFEWGFLPKKLHPKTARFIQKHGSKWWKRVLLE